MEEFSWSDLLALIADDQGDTDGYGSMAWVEVRRRLAVLALVVQRGMPALTSEDAEDIVQQAMLQMRKSSATLTAVRNATAPHAYLLRLVRNAAIDTVRRSARFAPLQDEASSVAHQSDVALDVQSLMRTLSEEERELVVMRFWKGMSLAEISSEKGLPYSTIAKRFFRLMSRLRTQIDEEQ